MAEWFYHAPSKAMPRTEPVMVPPTSQIPGLSEQPEGYGQPDEPKRMLLKESDSAYVRLAKQGGRQDLLRQHTPKPLPEQAKGYPRVDWFYQDDIAMEESQRDNKPEPKEYEFLQPEYMVHQEWSGGEPGGYMEAVPPPPHAPQRLPYAQNTQSIHQEEGRSATDKTRRIDEERKPGYGVRLDKMKPKPPVHLPPMGPPERGRGRAGELDQDLPRYNTMPATKPEDNIMMSKLLSYGYQKDWLEDHKKWEDTNGTTAAERQALVQPTPPPPQANGTEQQRTYQPRNRSGQYRRSAQQQAQAANQQFGSRESSANRNGTHKRMKSEDQGRPDFFNLTPSGSRSGTYYRKSQESAGYKPSFGDGRRDLQPYQKLGPIPGHG